MAAYRLRKGKVYRTEDFARFDANPTRYAARLVEQGKLRSLRHGLFYAPVRSVFGDVPPSEEQLLESFFRGKPYLRTGPSRWNSLGLGSTSVEVVPLVYNTTRTGELELAGRRFELRRVDFPSDPDPEYFVIDLLENVDRAGVARSDIEDALKAAVNGGRFDRDRLAARASEFGTRATQSLVKRVTAMRSAT